MLSVKALDTKKIRMMFVDFWVECEQDDSNLWFKTLEEFSMKVNFDIKNWAYLHHVYLLSNHLAVIEMKYLEKSEIKKKRSKIVQ